MWPHDRFLEAWQDPESKYYGRGQIPDAYKKAFGNTESRKLLQEIAELEQKYHKIHSFSLSDTSTAQLDEQYVPSATALGGLRGG